jgi:hypothetical protein
MPEIDCRKVLAGSLPPETEVIVMDEPTSWFRKLVLNRPLVLIFTAKRNYQFHKKFFALLDFAYEHWEPGELSGPRFEGVTPLRSKERFRKDLTVLAGHFDQEVRIDGSLRIVAKTISFAGMSEDAFSEFYERMKDVIWERIFQHITTYSREEFERVALELSSF